MVATDVKPNSAKQHHLVGCRFGQRQRRPLLPPHYAGRIDHWIDKPTFAEQASGQSLGQLLNRRHDRALGLLSALLQSIAQFFQESRRALGHGGLIHPLDDALNRGMF